MVQAVSASPPSQGGPGLRRDSNRATDFLLSEQPQGPLFNEVSFGSYLAWAAQPAYPVFVDPRIELYPLDLWLDYLNVSAAQGDWEQRLNKYGVQTLMLSPTTQPALVAAAQGSPEWTEIYADGSAVILTRRRLASP